MKKISLILTLLTCATATHNSFTMSMPDPFVSERMPTSYPPREGNDKQEHNDEYDIKKEVRKFREKHGKPKTDPLFLRYHDKTWTKASEDEYLESLANSYAKIKNEILDSIEKNGSAAIDSFLTDIGENQGLVSTISIAVENNDLPFVKFLLQHGANPNRPTELHYVTRYGLMCKTFYPIDGIRTVKMQQYLEDNGTDVSRLFDDPNDRIHNRVPFLANDKDAEKEKKRKLQEEFANEAKIQQ